MRSAQEGELNIEKHGVAIKEPNRLDLIVRERLAKGMKDEDLSRFVL